MNPRQKRVLCVEDDADTCYMLSSLLGLINCEVTTAGSVADAWSKIRERKIDLYVLDNWLPGGSGVELCRGIRKIDAVTPILFYSGAAYDSDRQQAMAAGAQDYLVKPADIGRLVAAVRRLLQSND